MTKLERKIIERIRSSEDPDALMDYIEELLVNPQKLQEALEEQYARLGTCHEVP